jgi:hypothetical protein
MSSTVQASDGAMLPLDSLEQEIAYAGTQVISITVNYPPGSLKFYKQTFTYTGVNLTDISGWILQ